MTNTKYYIGPMSLNVVDCTVEHSKKRSVGLIPSRRQIDFTGGYVNNWTTKAFSEYVRSFTKNVSLCRDHGGPAQGSTSDNGIDSIKEDAKYFDLIHIDPFKQTKDLEQAVFLTKILIEDACQQSSNVLFEVGTEEAICKYEPKNLNQFLSALKKSIDEKFFAKIKYAVVQSGTGLDLANMRNTGTFDAKRLAKFVDVCKRFNVASKEHNGDYLTEGMQLKQRFDIGLDAINIAPEFGQIETEWYLNACKRESDLLHQTLFDICYTSNKWSKWVSKHNSSELTKDSYIRMAGHYLLSDPRFLSEIKAHFPQADSEIKQRIQSRLESLHEQTKDYCI
jgi:hypothetical protein